MSNRVYGVLKNRATGLEIPGERSYDYYDADSSLIQFRMDGASSAHVFSAAEFEFIEKPWPISFPAKVGAIIRAKNFISLDGEHARDAYFVQTDSELGWMLFSGDPDGIMDPSYDESTLKEWEGTPVELGLPIVSYEVIFDGIDEPENSP